MSVTINNPSDKPKAKKLCALHNLTLLTADLDSFYEKQATHKHIAYTSGDWKYNMHACAQVHYKVTLTLSSLRTLFAAVSITLT